MRKFSIFFCKKADDEVQEKILTDFRIDTRREEAYVSEETKKG